MKSPPAIKGPAPMNQAAGATSPSLPALPSLPPMSSNQAPENRPAPSVSPPPAPAKPGGEIAVHDAALLAVAADADT